MFNERIALAISSLAGHDLLEALSVAKRLGFQSVMVFPGGKRANHSLGKFPTLNFYEGSEDELTEYLKLLQKFKHISLHQSWDAEWQRWIDCASYFGAEVLTIHASTLAKRDQEEMLEWQVSCLRQIGNVAQSKGIRIGVENEGGSYLRYVNLIHAIDHPAVGATIDVGHCAYFNECRSIPDFNKRAEKLNEIICRLLRDLKEKVYHLHVHNVQRYDAVDFSNIPNPYWQPGSFVDHRSVAEGEIDFTRVFIVLKEIGYHHLLDIELEEPEAEEKAFESGEYLTNLMKQLNF